MSKSSKGGEFEREFSKLFSRYVTEGKRDDIFWRSSQSGGRATQRAKKNLKTEGAYGDITCLDSNYAFVIKACCFELKRGYNGTNLQDMVDGTKKHPELELFWNQCERDRKLGGRLFSIVVTKRDRKKPVITIPRKLHYLISREIKLCLYNRIDINYNGMAITSIPLSEFFGNIPALSFLKILKNQLDIHECIPKK